ncbi:hypothetical protein F4560_001070 [Saccharothrix ecbatanensis]|uniref:Uncharacterized protein n=1 Tax=Saccharothrix ecbatanensis TaxID=1105145 RepID=A0A7W9HFG9_9PSEU|nr:hypothetical protein [Saccharothrix ecbatanensis]MBB5801302.1 hypothetical protein [Saccharothrix ecbatanensis]
MSAVLHVDNEQSQLVEDDSVTVSIEFPWETASAYRCSACREPLTETVTGYVDSSGESECWSYVPSVDEGPDVGPHVPERVPLAWVNSAAINVDETEDAVTVSISVGDPRGAFCFQVRRVRDDAPGELAGRLVLHVPHPGDSTPHKPLTALHAGTCLIG